MNPGRLSFPFHGDEMVDLEKFGSAWNTYLQNHARRSENASHRMSELEKVIDDQKKSIVEHSERIKTQAATVISLEARAAQLSEQNNLLAKANDDLQGQVEQSRMHKKEMQEKVKSYRGKLNEAIVEQQELYKRCKLLCDGTIETIRVEKEESVSQQRQALDQVETGMQKAVKARSAMKGLLEDELRSLKVHCTKGMVYEFSSTMGRSNSLV